ncbi:MAG: 23S rRNA (uracil(1939)-C(5))-methyltransferase RlmD, partial [Clostridiales bacterium]|nr:23S rRNA (uracil(1939)-C(5))-methyltransferase RlmD [Clostridiales bacterium]
IGKTDEGYPFFVGGAVPGDVVSAQITKINKTYGFAKIKRIITPSERRTVPKCAFFEKCGGCSIMHADYELQLEIKKNLVSSNLAKIGGYEVGSYDYEGIVGADKIFGYRNKAQFPVGTSGRAVCGFYEKSSHNLVPCTECLIQDEAINITARIIMDFVNKYSLTVYNEKKHSGIVRHIYVRTGADNSVMAVIVTNSRTKIEHAYELAQMLLREVNLKSLVQNVNTAKGNVILGKENILLWGEQNITASVGNIEYVMSPNSFFQVNYEQMYKLYSKAKEYAALTGTETIFDLYCGVGSISLFMADCAAEVIGVEIVEPAVKNAVLNAKLNGITNAKFYCGDCPQVVSKLVSDGLRADVVVVDPPRKGCDERTLDLIKEISPSRVVYVSCNSSTLARDVKILRNCGYVVKKCCAVDMFPQSMHVETVCLMSRKDK